MGLREQIDSYTSRVDAIQAEFSSELEALQAKLDAKGQVDPDVQASLDALGQHISNLEGAEKPTATDDSTGVVTPPTVVPPSDPATTPPGTLATDSPGEPSSQGVVAPLDPSAPVQAAGDLPPETPTVPADSVDGGTVAPDAPISAAGDVSADAPVVVVVPPADSAPSGEDTVSQGATTGDSTTTDESGTPTTEVAPEENV